MIPDNPHTDDEPTNPEPGPETEPVTPEPSDPIPAHVEDPVEEGDAFTPDDQDGDDQDDGEA